MSFLFSSSGHDGLWPIARAAACQVEHEDDNDNDEKTRHTHMHMREDMALVDVGWMRG
jgi:hypothetical protein